MRYVTWVQRVLGEIWGLEQHVRNRASGIRVPQLVPGLGLEPGQLLALHQGLADLSTLGLILISTNGHVLELTEPGRRAAGTSILAERPALKLAGSEVEDRAFGFLQTVSYLGEVSGEGFAFLKTPPGNTLTADRVYERLEWRYDAHEAAALTKALEDRGLIRRRAHFGPNIAVGPTYAGLVITMPFE